MGYFPNTALTVFCGSRLILPNAPPRWLFKRMRRPIYKLRVVKAGLKARLPRGCQQALFGVRGQVRKEPMHGNYMNCYKSEKNIQ